MLREPSVPGVPDVPQVSSAGFDRREPLHVRAPCHGKSSAVRSTPEWQSHDFAEAISGPASWRLDRERRRPRPRLGARRLHGSRKAPSAISPAGRLVVERRQRLAASTWPGAASCGIRKIPDAPRLFFRVDVGHRRIGRAQIDAHDVAAGRPSRPTDPARGDLSPRLQSSRVLANAEFQLPASVGFGATHHSSKTPSSVIRDWNRTGT